MIPIPEKEKVRGNGQVTTGPNQFNGADNQPRGFESGKVEFLTEDHPLVDRIGSRRRESDAGRLLSILDQLERGAA